MSTLLPEIVAAIDAADVTSLRRRRSAKWRAYPDDVIPAWVAEMDFPLAAPIRDRLHAAIEAGDVGYPSADRCGVRDALVGWLAREQGWTLEPEAVVVLPDTMRGVQVALLAHTAPGDAVVVPTPVYPPFLGVVTEHGRRLVEVELARPGAVVRLVGVAHHWVPRRGTGRACRRGVCCPPLQSLSPWWTRDPMYAPRRAGAAAHAPRCAAPRTCHSRRVSTRAWAAFAAVSVLWSMPHLLIRTLGGGVSAVVLR